MNRIVLCFCVGLAVLGGVHPATARASESEELTAKITKLTDELMLMRSTVVENRKDNYSQSFEDESIGVSFSYNTKKPFKVVPVTSVDDTKVTARSFQEGKKEGLFVSINDKQATTRITLFMSMLSGTSTNEEGTTFIANTAMVKEPILSRPLMRTEMKTITKQKKESGATMLFYEVRDEKNAFIGSVALSAAWGQIPNQGPNAKVTKYNGKVVKHKPYFKTKKEADAFLDEIINTLVVDENKVRTSLR